LLRLHPSKLQLWALRKEYLRLGGLSVRLDPLPLFFRRHLSPIQPVWGDELSRSLGLRVLSWHPSVLCWLRTLLLALRLIVRRPLSLPLLCHSFLSPGLPFSPSRASCSVPGLLLPHYSCV